MTAQTCRDNEWSSLRSDHSNWWSRSARGATVRCMTEAGFAVFALVAFLLPVPILAWLDRPRR